MSMSAFGVEQGELSKAIGLKPARKTATMLSDLVLDRPGVRRTALRIPKTGVKVNTTPVAGSDFGSKLGAVGSKIQQGGAAMKAKIAAGGLNPVKDGKLTTAGVGYVAGAGGVGTGAVLRGGRKDQVGKSAFGVEDDRLTKSMPHAGSLARGIRAREAARGAAAAKAHAAAGAAANMSISSKITALGEKAKATLNPTKMTPVGRRLTPAGVGYVAGAGGAVAGATAASDHRVRKSAFGVEDDRISKADNDKRGSAAPAGVAGGAVGTAVGVGASRKLLPKFEQEHRAADAHRKEGARLQNVIQREDLPATGYARKLRDKHFTNATKAGRKAMGVVGHAAARTGGGAAVGAAAGAGAYALHRHSRSQAET